MNGAPRFVAGCESKTVRSLCVILWSPTHVVRWSGRHEWGTPGGGGVRVKDGVLPVRWFEVSHPCRPPRADAMNGAPRVVVG